MKKILTFLALVAICKGGMMHDKEDATHFIQTPNTVMRPESTEPLSIEIEGWHEDF